MNDTSNGVGTVVSPIAGVDAGEWNALLAHGTSNGVVHVDSVSHVLRHAELSADLLTAVHQALIGRGISIDETLDEDHEEEVRARRRDRSAQRETSSDGALPADLVRQYLREIGRVGLLTAADERRLAQSITANRYTKPWRIGM